MPLPVGFDYTPDGRVVLDPDQQVQGSLRAFFQTFRRTGSAWSTVRAFREQGLPFPRRVRTGPRRGELVWGLLLHCRARQLLHNPRYAGAFFFGRTHTRQTAEGRSRVDLLPREQWHTLLRDAHPGYIGWEEYEENLRLLHSNAQAHGADRRHGPPREGPALLQGLVLCGRCGERMTVRYHLRGERLVPAYVCQKEGVESGDRICQQVPGSGLDRAMGELLVEAVTPLALEVSLTVQQELASRIAEADNLRLKQVERARYEADLAQCRYMRVDPDNRLVADVLEAEWNGKLRALNEAREEYERQRQADRRVLDERQRAEILSLATDFPRLWRSPETPDRERKRMARLLLEDVTLLKEDRITAHVRFKGGATRTLSLPIPPPAWLVRQTPPAAVQEIDRLLDHHTEGEIAEILNRGGYQPGDSDAFHVRIVGGIRRSYGLKDRFTRLREAGMLTLQEMSTLLGVDPTTVKTWHAAGLLVGTAFNDKGECVYVHPGDDLPTKRRGSKLSKRLKSPNPIESYGRGAV